MEQGSGAVVVQQKLPGLISLLILVICLLSSNLTLT